MKLKKFLFIQVIVSFLWLIPTFSSGQYTMSDAYVTDCEGTLSDSDEGPEEGQYDHNEDFTFTICVEGATAITAIFDFFATEDVYDILTVYDGPDTNSPIIAELEGVLSNPPILVATSGCMTFHFSSDDNIVALGWFLNWSVEVEEFADPELTIDSNLDCPLGSMDITIDPRIPCDIISPENFQLIGPDGAGISSAVALDCDADNTASQFSIFFDDSLSLSGSYNLIFSGYIVNTCGDTLYFESLLGFELTDCPFEVQIVLVDQACPGDCGQVQVEIYSSDPGPYSISWSHTTDDSEIVDICTDSAIWVSVLVENITTGISGDDQYWYEPLPLPIILNPLMSDTFCSTKGNHNFIVDNPGGLWNSTYMDNTDDAKYRFWKWTWSNGIQEDIITYTDPNGCSVNDTVYVIPITAGLDQAVCLSQGSLQLTGNNPSDGNWVGANTTTDGLFTTTIADTFYIQFINEEGCADWKRVFVIDSIEFSALDTICSNVEIDLRYYVNSLGGTWTGQGITNWYHGRLKAWQANINAWNTYYYTLDGCTDSMEIYIQGIWAGYDQTVCSSTESIQLPFNGNWSGPGIFNPLDSTYDISGLSPGEYSVFGEKSGCEDKMILTIHDVNISLNGPSIYCHDAGLIPIRDVVNSNPYDGTFSGESVVDIFGETYFDPSLISGNQSYVYFEALGCIDSVIIQVEQALNLGDYTFCEFGSLQTLDNMGQQGYWEGPGILIGATGLINLEELNIGFNEVYFISNMGCVTSVSIDIIQFVEAEILNVEESYCFQDTNFIIAYAPLNGIFTINGIVSAPVINPSVLGPGYHEIEYTVGVDECEDKMSIFIAVDAPISGITYAQQDTLCPDESTSIFVETSGGSDIISAIWDQGLGFGKSHIISPGQSTSYAVTLSDGCSDDVFLQLDIHVIDTFSVGVNYGPEVCYGDSSFIELELNANEDYEISWDGFTSPDGHVYNSAPGSYQVLIVDKNSGCEQEYELQIPGAEPLGADFTTIPNQDCIDLINNEITILDLAYGYSDGYLDFGEENSSVNLLTDDLIYEYNNIGEFLITQVVYNALGCSDTLSHIICVENVVNVFVPNIFSPNGDGVNDLFSVHALGIDDFSMHIYDRWGEQVFYSEDILESWDGRLFSGRAMIGVYTVLVKYKDQDTGWQFVEYFDVTLVR